MIYDSRNYLVFIDIVAASTYNYNLRQQKLFGLYRLVFVKFNGYSIYDSRNYLVFIDLFERGNETVIYDSRNYLVFIDAVPDIWRLSHIYDSRNYLVFIDLSMSWSALLNLRQQKLFGLYRPINSKNRNERIYDSRNYLVFIDSHQVHNRCCQSTIVEIIWSLQTCYFGFSFRFYLRQQKLFGLYRQVFVTLRVTKTSTIVEIIWSLQTALNVKDAFDIYDSRNYLVFIDYIICVHLLF